MKVGSCSTPEKLRIKWQNFGKKPPPGGRRPNSLVTLLRPIRGASITRRTRRPGSLRRGRLLLLRLGLGSRAAGSKRERRGHNDGLSLFAAAPVGSRGTASIILGVLSEWDRRCHVGRKCMTRTRESGAAAPQKVGFNPSAAANGETLLKMKTISSQLNKARSFESADCGSPLLWIQ